MKINVCVCFDGYEKIEVNENSVVEVVWNGYCRGEFFRGGSYEWKGIKEIKKGMKELERDMCMGEEGVEWIKVDGKVVYSCVDWKEWRDEMLSEIEDWDDEEGEEVRKELEEMSEENYYDMEWLCEMSDRLCCFSC